MIEALRTGRIAGAGLDVYDVEPLPADHPLRQPQNVTRPHTWYMSPANWWAAVYEDTAEAVAAWLAGNPVRVINDEALSTKS